MQTAMAPTQTNGNVQRKNHLLPICGIFKTVDYDLFKFLGDNRELNMQHVQRLVKSFEHRQLVSPVIVNEKYQVIDGQHRIEAAKISGMPVYYFIMPGYSIEEVKILNVNQKNWNKSDYLHMYCERKLKPYLEFQEFMTYFPDFGFRVCLRLLEGPKDTQEMLNGKMVHARRFEEGRFVVADLGKAYQVGRRITEFKPYFPEYFTDNFVGALLKIFKRKSYNHKEMLRKLDVCPKKIEHCDTVDRYVLHFEDIYNYKRSEDNKVSFRYQQK